MRTAIMLGRARQFFSSTSMRNWSPGTTGRRNFARSIPVNMMSLSFAVFHFGQQQRPARLGDGLHNQDSRHDGQVGKVSGKEGLVDGHILDGHDPLLALDLDHAVDQQKGKAVRQDVENIDDVQRGLYRRRGCGRWVSGVGHFLSSGSFSSGAKIILYRDSATEYCENRLPVSQSREAC